ncbi:Uncharacterized protein APZ42_030284 [Daphnia magna]|uniref:Uncharacterized protein n=1 Tax=Daphnia magna TaxID=35525 RepID=A0A164NXT9_9CRUS|nr:Uncharacterized protein APZ42_030284 [Daphnia magna]
MSWVVKKPIRCLCCDHLVALDCQDLPLRISSFPDFRYWDSLTHPGERETWYQVGRISLRH